ncbi:MAG TPA: ABC transporter substrate-binding protein [Thermotogota bacterium]|nr:ABC transporter substrate-binding protein [Thermotogota bacterium]HRW93688.1 ABC transporter substrate-binding protein [Thermotogota bacterium]
MKKALVVLLLFLVVFATLTTAAVKRGGYINMTPMKQGVLVKNFNPFSPNALEFTLGAFYETLVYYNPMTTETMFFLATDYEWSEDLKELTFTLRDGVEWNDGTPFTVADVLFSVNLGKENQALDQGVLWSVQGLQKVYAADYNKVTFQFEEVNTTVLDYFSNVYILPAHIWKDVPDPLTWTGNENPVGTGPFLYEEGSFTELSYRVKRNPNYWKLGEDGKPLPYIDGVQFISTTNEQAPLKFARGEYDWGGYFIANIEDTYVKADPENHKYWLPEGNLVFLNLNNLRWPFDEYKVRLAMAYAMDPEEITRIMASGAVPASISGLQSSYLFLAKDALDKYGVEYDPDYARELLEEAGYRLNSKGIYERDGKALSLKLYVPTGWTDWVIGCQVISDQLNEIGVEAIVTQAAWPTPYKDNLFNGNYEICLGIAVTGTNPHYQFVRWVHSDNWAPLGENAGNYYGMRYKNETITRALDAYQRTADREEQNRLMAQVVEQFLADMPSVPLFFNPVWFEYNTKTFVGWPNADNPYANPRPSGMDKLPILFTIHLK